MDPTNCSHESSLPSRDTSLRRHRFLLSKYCCRCSGHAADEGAELRMSLCMKWAVAGEEIEYPMSLRRMMVYKVKLPFTLGESLLQ